MSARCPPAARSPGRVPTQSSPQLRSLTAPQPLGDPAATNWALRWRSAIRRPILTLAVALLAVPAAARAADQADKWQPYLEFHADLATGSGGGGGGELFVPLQQDRHALLFGDFRGGVGSRAGDADGGGTSTGVPAYDGWSFRHPQP